MARLWHGGFELNSSAEFKSVNGAAATIQSSVVRTGSYAGKISSLSSGTRAGFLLTFTAAANGPFFIRGYVRVDTLPSANNTIIALINGTAITSTISACIKITSTGTLILCNSTGTQIGSASSALSLNTWYRVEIKIDLSGSSGAHILEAKIDGIIFATASNLTISNQVQSFVFGANIQAETQTVGVFYFDDFAVNDNSGSSQNSYPNKGGILHAKPNGAGDNTNWIIGGTSPALTNWQNVSEVSPDDGASLVTGNVNNLTDDYTVESISGISSGDIINAVAVGTRVAGLGSGGSNATYAARLKAVAGGTVTQGTTATSNGTAWSTNQQSNNIRSFLLVSYSLPGTSTPWTKSDLSASQIGIKIVAFSTFADQLSTIWLSVDFAPISNFTSTLSDSVTLTESLSKLIAYKRTISASISLAESLTKITGLRKAFTEIRITLVESISRGFQKTFSEIRYINLLTEDSDYLLTEDDVPLVVEPTGIDLVEYLHFSLSRTFREAALSLIDRLVIRLNGEWYRRLTQGWKTVRSTDWYERVVNGYFTKN